MKCEISKKCHYFFIIILFFILILNQLNINSLNVIGIQNIKNINSIKKPNKDDSDKIIYVGKHGDYPTIQAALNSVLNAAEARNTSIYVYNGTYAESIRVNAPFKCLKGGIPYANDTDHNGSIINATNTGESSAVLITGTDNCCFHIDNFVIRNSCNGQNCGIKIKVNNVNVSNCRISGSYYGIYMADVYSCWIFSNNITNNKDDGIYSEQSYSCHFRRNNISNNGHWGIYLNFLCTNNYISYNNVSFNLGGIAIHSSPINFINFNNIFNNSDSLKDNVGIWIVLCGLVNAKYNWWGASDPVPYNSLGQEIWLDFSRPCGRTLLNLFKPWKHTQINIYNSTSDITTILTP